MGGFAASPSPSSSLEASEDEDAVDGSGDDDEDEDEDASSSSDKEITTSQWLTLCQSWRKGGSSFGMRVVMYLGGELA